MTKQSFFDKLTGTLKVKEEGVKSQEGKLPSPPALPRALSQNISETKISEDIMEKSALRLKEETGHSEVEGQLTVDVYQTPGEIVIKSTIAGVTIDELDISITNDMVTIRGERKKDEDVSPQDYFHQECYWGPFSRSIILPIEVDSENAAASFHNGILTIRLPKAEKVKTKKIKISE